TAARMHKQPCKRIVLAPDGRKFPAIGHSGSILRTFPRRTLPLAEKTHNRDRRLARRIRVAACCKSPPFLQRQTGYRGPQLVAKIADFCNTCDSQTAGANSAPKRRRIGRDDVSPTSTATCGSKGQMACQNSSH